MEDISYHKRKLPHIQSNGMPNFITFRTNDSIDAYVKKITLSNLENKQKQYQIDNYLDNSKDGAYLNNTELALMKEILFEYDNILYELVCFAIMPNHIHLLVIPKDTLSNIMKRVKGKSAKILNESLKKDGKFWAREYYDKVIRDEKQFENSVRYILNNPLKVDLRDADDRVYSRFGLL